MADLTIEVPTPDGTRPLQRQVTRLDGRDLVLTYRYNFRCAAWYLDVDDYPSTRLVTGVRVRPGVDLLEAVPSLGVLHVVHTDVSTPDLTAFGEARARLYYEPLSQPWEGQP